MTPIRPQPKALTSWRILLAVGMCVPAFLTSLLFRPGGRLWAWGMVVWLLVFLAAYLVYLPLRHRKLYFSIAGDKVLLYSGVLYTSVRFIPLRSIQYTVITTTPLDRLFGLSGVRVVAAGGHITLPGLRRKDAEALSAILSEPHLAHKDIDGETDGG